MSIQIPWPSASSRLVLLVPLLAACSGKWSYLDEDGDGISAAEGDCWDAAEGPPGSGLSGGDIYPGAAETWYDGFDQDCGGDSDYDADSDGFVPEEWVAVADGLPGGDCDDTLADVNPDAADEWYDGVDADCSGNDDYDQDGDGYVADEYAGLETDYVDGSGALPGGDCDDLLGDVNPEAGDEWYDGVDSDCSGNDDYDQDGDGYVPLEYDGLETEYVPGSGALEAGDCDDTDAEKFPDPSAEVIWYNGEDERCNENDGDQDGDGFWIENYEELVADAGGTPLAVPSGRSGDCFDDVAQRPDDGDTSDPLVPINGGSLLDPDEIHPGAADDPYDGVDADCADDSDFDKDGDGYDSECVPQRDGSYGDDCLDDDDSGACGDADLAGIGALGIYPGAFDTWYDGTDQDCSDNDDFDADYDGYANRDYSADYDDYADAYGVTPLDTTDCDDDEPDVSPAETDRWYDGVDTDCSGNDDYDQDYDGYVPDAYEGRATTYVDGSGDLPGNDCDDTEADVNPGEVDSWYDGEDTNCSGNDDFDRDSDGYVPDDYVGRETEYVAGSGDLPGNDCDDGEADVNPGEVDSWYDGEDTNCSGNDDFDRDSDGYVPDEYVGRETEYVDGSGDLPGNDCDDTESDVNPGESDSWYDGIDQDCGGEDDYDSDGDGYVPTSYEGRETTYVDGSGDLPGNDCDDTRAGVNPDATDTWYDGEDTDCQGEDDFDADEDGYVPDEYAGETTRYVSGSGSLPDNDCDDTDPTVNPGEADTWYDGEDTNCGGNDDYDADGDGYVPDAYVGLETDYVDGSGDLPGNDCDDTDDSVNPDAIDVWYDGVDQDCQGEDDYDADEDGYVPTAYEGLETDYVDGSGDLPGDDCDDEEPDVNPGETDVWYDGIDQDCQGEDDYDADEDGYVPTVYVGRSTTYVSGSGTLPGDDCDDDAADVNPGETDTWYDGVDQDCQGEDDYDADEDGYVPDAYIGLSTEYVSGSGTLPGNDCDDDRAAVNPDASETCSTTYDDDCDDDTNDIDAIGCDDWYRDVDDDTWGTTDSQCTCEAEGVYTASRSGDCDDGTASTYPGATDTWYDGVDSDCGDDDDYDRDGDGYAREGETASSLPATDCDDTDEDVNPAATEVWYDGTDQDCDDADDYDADGDGFALEGETASSLPDTDCNDNNSSIKPTATEIWYDGIDRDCDDADDYDADGDGFALEGETASSLPDTDCDDGDSSIRPTATEIWYDGTDQDCDDADDYDADGDGYAKDGETASSLPDTDCDDADAGRNPGETDLADGVEEDCDGFIDEDDVEVGDLIITEIMINSADTGSETWEWFEVYNTSADDIYLDNWEFNDAIGSNESFYVSDEAAVSVAPGDYAVFCQSSTIPGLDGSGDCDYVYGSNSWTDPVEGAAANSNFKFNNNSDGALGIYLDGGLIDEVDTTSFDETPVYGNGVSAELSMDHFSETGNDTLANWCEATSVFVTTTPAEGYDGDHFGTPGLDNDCTGP